ncbi:MAG TPA: hypothetical protein VN445_07110 [Rectinemataceae bacterium]|nr:hypothetical protein [Rectinemataceae bacterium]
MNTFPSARRGLCSLYLASILTFLLFSCSSEEISSFSWKSASGENLPFAQKAGFPDGKENAFSGARPKNTYSLRKPMPIGQDLMLAVSMNVKREDLIIAFFLGSETRKAGQETRFAAKPGNTVFYLSVPPSPLRTLTIGVELPLGQAADKKDETSLADVELVSILPAFRGYEHKIKNGYRISDGIVIDRNDAVSSVWELKRPFRGLDASTLANDRAPALVLRYARRANAEIVVKAGKEVAASCASAKKEFIIPASVFGGVSGEASREASGDIFGQASMTITVPDEILLEAAFIEALPAETVSRVDPGVMLLEPPLSGKEDFAWYRWDLLPNVIMFDFRDYAVQDDYLKRLAFFVEKRGFAGTLAKDEEIASLHGWNAHDYKADDLAKFFSAAAKSEFPLSERELRLRDFLVEKGLLTKRGNAFGSRNGAIISISQESDAYLRHKFITHESSHAIFFTDGNYRDLCVSLWNGMTKEEKWFWILYFGWMNYDTKSAALMANEVQAYLIQQPPSKAMEYFSKTLVDRLLEKHPELEAPLAAYMEKFGAEFEKKARMLDGWLRSTYGFGAGTTFFLK